MKTLYLDESGDHNLLKIDDQYPIFVLGGIIMDSAYANGAATNIVNAFKQDIFGRTDIILHTADISRNKKGFERLKEKDFKASFLKKLNRMMTELEFMVVACAIRKRNHAERYQEAAMDPYVLSLNILAERFCYEIGSENSPGSIIAECRDSKLDAELNTSWSKLQISGTRYLKSAQLRKQIEGLHLRPKSENITGLQIADLVVSPIGRYLLGKKIQEDWNIVSQKFRRKPGTDSWEGHGLVVLPK